MQPQGQSPQELAAFWNCICETILRAIRRGDLPAVRIGPKTIRVLKVDASAYYAAHSRCLLPSAPTQRDASNLHAEGLAQIIGMDEAAA